MDSSPEAMQAYISDLHSPLHAYVHKYNANITISNYRIDVAYTHHILLGDNPNGPTLDR